MSRSESGPESLSVVSAVMTRLPFPLPLVGSSRWRGRRASTERSLGGESNSTRRLRGQLSRDFLTLFVNQVGEYQASNMVRTGSLSSRVSLTMSAKRREGALSARSRVNLGEAFERPTFSRALWVVVDRTKMASRGASGKSQLWCRKLETRTSRYESSVAMWASCRGLRDATAAQVADGSDRSTGGARARRVWCTALAEARGGRGGIFAVAVALWGREDELVCRPVLYALCAREDACTALSAERFLMPSASARMRYS